jgi:uncharacterized membrane protein YphA (DoxX/SURF4 family)
MKGSGFWRYLRRPDLLAAPLHALAALATRLLVGFTLARQGIGRFGGNLASTVQWLADHGWPLPSLAAPALALLELLGGVGILVGLGTRVWSLLLAAVMLAQLLTTGRERLLEAVVPGGDIGLLEVYPLVMLMLLCWLIIRRAGRLSLDHMLGRKLGIRRSAARAADQTVPTRIVILGGGFGGMYAAMELERIFGDDPQVRVTVVNQDNFLLFTPMLHEVAASDLDLTHIVSATRKLLSYAEFVNGEVRGVDLERRTVTVVHGEEGLQHVLQYDHRWPWPASPASGASATAPWCPTSRAAAAARRRPSTPRARARYSPTTSPP